MSGFAPKATLTGIPPEVLDFIIPDPLQLYNSIGEANPGFWKEWCPIRWRWNLVQYDMGTNLEQKDAVLSLRSLSQVCRKLRARTLPVLWSIVHIATVDELERLSQLLRVSPYLAQYVRNFSFTWTMCGDFSRCEGYAEAEGTLLQLAFRNRWCLWNDRRLELGADTQWDYEEPYGPNRMFYEHEDLVYHAPGHPHIINFDGYQQLAVHDYDAPIEGANGPDGEGKEVIRTAEQLLACITEVVGRLTAIETFGWATPVTPMPQGVFDALTRLKKLSSLHLDLTSHRSNVHAFPFWKISGNLTRLSLQLADVERQDLNEAVEEDFQSFQLPTELPTDKAARDAMHAVIACRTLIAAAKGGHLRHLNCAQDFTLQAPFTIRSFLHHWILVEQQGVGTYPSTSSFGNSWSTAAVTLRCLLEHISKRPLNKFDRFLTRQDVQGLRKSLKTDPMRGSGPIGFAPQPIGTYLAWLEEDEELSQRIAEAWNSLVKSGKSGVHKCGCESCKPPPPRSRFGLRRSLNWLFSV